MIMHATFRSRKHAYIYHFIILHYQKNSNCKAEVMQMGIYFIGRVGILHLFSKIHSQNVESQEGVRFYRAASRSNACIF